MGWIEDAHRPLIALHSKQRRDIFLLSRKRPGKIRIDNLSCPADCAVAIGVGPAPRFVSTQSHVPPPDSSEKLFHAKARRREEVPMRHELLSLEKFRWAALRLAHPTPLSILLILSKGFSLRLCFRNGRPQGARLRVGRRLFMVSGCPLGTCNAAVKHREKSRQPCHFASPSQEKKWVQLLNRHSRRISGCGGGSSRFSALPKDPMVPGHLPSRRISGIWKLPSVCVPVAMICPLFS